MTMPVVDNKQAVARLCKGKTDSIDVRWRRAQCLGSLLDCPEASSALVSHVDLIADIVETLLLDRAVTDEVRSCNL